jgi:hypothetical protein
MAGYGAVFHPSRRKPYGLRLRMKETFHEKFNFILRRMRHIRLEGWTQRSGDGQ